MTNASFSSLIYRIIGKPERWHDDYIVEMMEQYLDEEDTFDDPSNLTELAAGDQILSRIQQGNAALNAFNTLLDKSRFKMIILDEQLNPLYHNQIAESLYKRLQDPANLPALRPDLVKLIRSAPEADSVNKKNALMALDFLDENSEQIYMRSILSSVKERNSPTQFYILMVLDRDHADLNLNTELISLYKLTEREQTVVLGLIHGNSIKQIAENSFITENTVKTHLKSIFNKTRTNSQGALISLILTHESQVLDSYFESDISTATAIARNENDSALTLASGVKIAYCDYGPKNGRPIVVFHSAFGSRLSAPPNYAEICERTNRRLIIPDRPGIGKTKFIEGHPEQWNWQLNEFIEQLEIEQYDVMGSVIACQMALSFAAQADDKLQKLILTCPVILNDNTHAQYLTEILAPAARYVRLSPTFAKEIYELWLKSVTLNLDAHYPLMLHESIGSSEQEYFAADNMIQHLTNAFKECARESLDGILNEMVFCMTPLNLDLSEFHTPTEVWYGTDDKRINQEGVETIYSEFPNCTVNIREGYSEHLHYPLLEEIIA